MAQHIVATFQTEDARTLASQQLRSAGYTIIRDFVTEEGAWVMVVNAPFGRAASIIDLLRANGALAVREVSSRTRYRTDSITSRVRPEDAQIDGARSRTISSPDESFFVSSMIGLPLLIDCPAPLSSLLGLPTLIREE